MKKLVLSLLLCAPIAAHAHEPHVCGPDLPDDPVLSGHLEQADIVDGRVDFAELLEVGRQLLVGQFNVCDGQGRPAATGTGEKRLAPPAISS